MKDEKIKRLTELAHEAMKRYDISDYETEFIRHNENITFKIIDKTWGQKYLLRIHTPAALNLLGIQHTFEGLRSEYLLLSSLREGTDLRLQKHVENKSGRFITPVSDTENNGAYGATLLTWIEGSTFSQNEANAKEIAFKIGRRVAQIHDFSNSGQMPQPLSRPVYDWDKYMYMTEKLGYGITTDAFDKADYDICMQAMDYVRDILSGIESSSDNWGIIHADLQGSNVIVQSDGDISLIDFGFSGYGYYLFDIGDALSVLRPELKKPFLEGYASVRPIGDEDYRIISACMLMSALGSFSFHINNENVPKWMRKQISILANDICTPFMRGEEILLKL